MIIEYKCECGNKIEMLYKKSEDIKDKLKCKKCGKMAKKAISLFDYTMEKDGTRNKK